MRNTDPMGTVVVAREMRVRSGHEHEFESAMSLLMEEASRQPGHLGVTVLRPSTPKDSYRFLYRFDSIRNLDAWHASAARAHRMEAVAPHVESDRFDVRDGFAVWLDLPMEGPEPVKWRVVAVTWLAIFPTVTLWNAIFGLFPLHVHPILKTMMLTAVAVPFAAYVMSPPLMRIFHRWIHA